MRHAWAVATALGVLGLLPTACSKKDKAPEVEPFTCDLLQQRAETCAPQALARVKADLASRKDHEQQYKMFEIRFNKRLAQKTTKAQCEKFSADKARATRVDAMKACYAKSGCDAFTACMFQL